MQDQPLVKKDRRTKLTIALEWAEKLTRSEKERLAAELTVLIEADKETERKALQAQLEALK